MHRAALERPRATVPAEIHRRHATAWDAAIKSGEQYGYRNGTDEVLAPTGTIGFLMDCDTTGIEPDLALVKYKQLVGGGSMKIVNRTVPLALKRLGYSADETSKGSSPTSTRRHDRRRARISSPSTCRSSTARSAR